MVKTDKQCILHVGIHKTGSTAIQHALAGYDDGTSAYGDFGIANHSIPFGVMFADKEKAERAFMQRLGSDYADEIRKKYRSDFDRSLSQNHSRVIFSAERLSTFETQALAAIRDVIGQHCNDIKVMVFVREPMAWAASWTQQAFKMNLPLDLAKVSPGFRTKHERLIDVFGRENVHVYRYEEKNDLSGNIIDLFVEKVGGLDPRRINYRTSTLNTSMPEATLKAMYRVDTIDELGDMLKSNRELRKAFIMRLNALGINDKIDISQFANVIDFDDYRYINSLIDKPYDLPSSSSANLAAYLRAVEVRFIDAVKRQLMTDTARYPKTDDVDQLLIQFCESVRLST